MARSQHQSIVCREFKAINSPRNDLDTNDLGETSATSYKAASLTSLSSLQRWSRSSRRLRPSS
ncbi:unnamed protein product [Arabis nemorensis]|uniref:Uncharacterized protein n=1 Tax=Arabis nemorensis TaxID=586526 RepID=A0A565CS56_9BRAS|nr:unnamed protein product [Arabis nemorensis]